MDIARERYEAIEAGNRALMSLEAAYHDLKSARNWGWVDMLGSRSFLTSIIKHGKMENAQRHMDQAKYDLNRFGLELNDVNMACDLNINVSGLLSFVDVFADNIFADVAVQSRIAQAARQVERAIAMVQDALARLERM